MREIAEADASNEDATLDRTGASAVIAPDGPYRPDVGLRNGVLISTILWLVLIGAIILF